MQLHGIHHVTAVTAKIGENADFYTNFLGLRLVKKSVNQDDVSAYHLFYADKVGTPGTDMTFLIGPTSAQIEGALTVSSPPLSGLTAVKLWTSGSTGLTM